MSVKINTGTGYVGEVTLTYIVNGKKLRVKKYNKGWSKLFEFIARCLGDAEGSHRSDSIESGRPKFLDIKCKHSGGNWESCLFNYVSVSPSYTSWIDSSMQDYGGVNYYATFTTTISYNMINQAILAQYDSSDDCALFLMSGSDGTYYASDDLNYRMAQLLLDISSLKSVSAGTQVIVEWNLRFYNKE